MVYEEKNIKSWNNGICEK